MSATQHKLYARRYDSLEPVGITISNGMVTRVEPAWPGGPVADWPIVAPGLFDLQVNGCAGVWFSDAQLTAQKAAQALRPYFAAGVTRLCPTLITASFDAMAAGLKALRAACEAEPWVDKLVAGIHLEGPYLSGEDGPRGAHPKDQIRPANVDEFARWQEISGGRVRLMTVAPEVPGVPELIRQCVAAGIRIAIGHTAANSAQITAAVDAGAVLSTHLGNAAHGMLRRHPNYIWDQLGDARLAASVITDGHHIPASLLRSVIAAKGVRNTIITCDASGWAGCAPGEYKNELGHVEVKSDGRIVVAGQDQFLAGSSSLTHTCVKRAMDMAGVSLRQAIEMASGNPARLLGFPDGDLRRGDRADLIVFTPPASEESDLQILCTIAAGEVQYGQLPALESRGPV